MRFRKKTEDRRDSLANRDVAVDYCRAISDDEWRRLKRAVEGYRKADKVLSGEDTDSDINDAAEQLIET